MEPGNIVEYLDKQKIVCAVVRGIKKQRLQILTENNREVKLSFNRLSHKGGMLNSEDQRTKLVDAVKARARVRQDLSKQINVEELWEILNVEQEWIDLDTMIGLCFTDEPCEDHGSAVIRAMFSSRIYFKFDHNRFQPYPLEHVAKIKAETEKARRKALFIENGVIWLQKVMRDELSSTKQDEYIKILASVFLLGEDSPYENIGRAILSQAGLSNDNNLFKLLVKSGVFQENENLDLKKYNLPVLFSEKIKTSISQLHCQSSVDSHQDLTHLRLITIDGPSTLDFDDALSLEKKGEHYLLGVHIADVAKFIKKDDSLDQEARKRVSSIYMPEQKIPMFPDQLSEDISSLRAEQIRPVISTMITLNRELEVIDYEIISSLVRVQEQLTYHDVDQMLQQDQDLDILYAIAVNFRQKRLNSGAIQLSLPEINVWLDIDGQPCFKKIKHEGPSRMLVAEIMIMANWLMGGFLKKNAIPAIFRAQSEPRQRLIKNTDTTLFQNWMQRKCLGRFMLTSKPERHASLGLDYYLTATSPIRKYFDLITQRQIRSVFGLESGYSRKQIDEMILTLEQQVRLIARVQNNRKNYWLLKFLENKQGCKEEIYRHL